MKIIKTKVEMKIIGKLLFSSSSVKDPDKSFLSICFESETNTMEPLFGDKY